MGRNIALIFEKTSTRTRSAFEVAAHDQGAHVSYLGPGETQLGKKESIRDTARVLGRMYDGIEFRGFAHQDVEDLAQYAGVPVWNGLTDRWHPTQMLADMLTMRDHRGSRLRGSRTATSATPGTTPPIRCWSPAPCWGWTQGSVGLGHCGLRRTSLRLPATWPIEVCPPEHHRGSRGSSAGRRLSLHGRLGLHGRADGDMGGTHRRTAPVPDHVTSHGPDREPRNDVHALSAGHARPPHRVGRDALRQVRTLRARGYRRGVRVLGVDRLRPGREPPAHDQGGHGGDAERTGRVAQP